MNEPDIAEAQEVSRSLVTDSSPEPLLARTKGLETVDVMIRGHSLMLPGKGSDGSSVSLRAIQQAVRKPSGGDTGLQ